MAVHIVNEARRCLHCKNPQCRKGCPISTPIPLMIEKILHGESKEAGRILFENNPLSMICSLVCDNEKQCEGHCILNHKDAPIHISSIENYISEAFLNRLNLESKPPAEPVVCTTPSRRWYRRPHTGPEIIRQLQLLHSCC